MHKKCIKCFLEKSIEDFKIRTDTKKRRNSCNDCLDNFHKEYRGLHREKAKKVTKDWIENNLERSRKSVRKWRKENIEYARKKEVEYKIKRLKTDHFFRMVHNLRRRMLHALKDKVKFDKSISLIGCNREFLRKHLESQFTEGMTWENHGRGDDKWHVDHIKPCDSFDLTQESEQYKCFNYTNLQPMWQPQNLSKGTIFYEQKN